MSALSHLAPEEIAGLVLLVLVVLVLALHPATLSGAFASPYATPAPGGGPARQLVPDPITP